MQNQVQPSAPFKNPGDGVNSQDVPGPPTIPSEHVKISRIGALRLPTATDLKSSASLTAVCTGFVCGAVYAWVAVALAAGLRRDPYDVVPAIIGVFTPLIVMACIVRITRAGAFGRGCVAGLIATLAADTALGFVTAITHR